MARSWVEPTDNFLERERERDRLRKFGLHDRDDYPVVHQRELDAADRAYERGGEPWRLVARQPHPRERAAHRAARVARDQERDAQLALYPDRPLDSQVTPLGKGA